MVGLRPAKQSNEGRASARPARSQYDKGLSFPSGRIALSMNAATGNTVFRVTDGEFLTESLILAQDERWRRA
jgi:hypothetical protein